MKKFVTLLVTLLVVASMTFCAVAEEKTFACQTLTVSTFSFNAELMQKNIYQPFMEQTGATVVIDSGRNAERVTKIIEAPENYDVVVIGDMFVKRALLLRFSTAPSATCLKSMSARVRRWARAMARRTR